MAKQFRRQSRLKKLKKDSPFKNYWENTNYILLGVGVFILVVGFYLMTFGPWDNPISLSISPIVLLLAYLIVFPISILYKKKKRGTEENVPSKN